MKKVTEYSAEELIYAIECYAMDVVKHSNKRDLKRLEELEHEAVKRLGGSVQEFDYIAN